MSSTVQVIDLTASDSGTNDETTDNDTIVINDSDEEDGGDDADDEDGNVDGDDEYDQENPLKDTRNSCMEIQNNFRTEYGLWNLGLILGAVPNDWSDDVQEQYNFYCVSHLFPGISAPAFACMRRHILGYEMPRHWRLDINGHLIHSEGFIVPIDLDLFYHCN